MHFFFSPSSVFLAEFSCFPGFGVQGRELQGELRDSRIPKKSLLVALTFGTKGMLRVGLKAKKKKKIPFSPQIFGCFNREPSERSV